MMPRVPSEPTKQRRQVITHDVLHCSGAGSNHGPVGQHDLQTQHRIPGHAVLEAPESAGVGRQIAADGGDLKTGRVRWIEHAPGRNGSAEIAVDHPGLGHRVQIIIGNIEDRGHPVRGQHNCGVDGAGSTGQPGSGASRNHRHPVLAGPPQGGGNLRGVGRQYHGQRPAGRGEIGCVAPIGVHLRGLENQRFHWQQILQTRYHRHADSLDVPPARATDLLRIILRHVEGNHTAGTQPTPSQATPQSVRISP